MCSIVCMNVLRVLAYAGLITAALIPFQVAVCLLACLLSYGSLFVVSSRHMLHVRALELYYIHAACWKSAINRHQPPHPEHRF